MVLSEQEKEQIIARLLNVNSKSEDILLVYDYYKQLGATKEWIPLLGLKASSDLNLDIATTKSALEDMCTVGIMQLKRKQVLDSIHLRLTRSRRIKPFCHLTSFEVQI